MIVNTFKDFDAYFNSHPPTEKIWHFPKKHSAIKNDKFTWFLKGAKLKTALLKSI